MSDIKIKLSYDRFAAGRAVSVRETANQIYRAAETDIEAGVQMLYCLLEGSKTPSGLDRIDNMLKMMKDIQGVNPEIIQKLRTEIQIRVKNGFKPDDKISDIIIKGLQSLASEGLIKNKEDIENNAYKIHLCAQMANVTPPLGEVLSDEAMIAVYSPKANDDKKRILYQMGGGRPVDIYSKERDLPVYLTELSRRLKEENISIRPQAYYAVEYKIDYDNKYKLRLPGGEEVPVSFRIR